METYHWIDGASVSTLALSLFQLLGALLGFLLSRVVFALVLVAPIAISAIPLRTGPSRRIALTLRLGGSRVSR